MISTFYLFSLISSGLASQTIVEGDLTIMVETITTYVTLQSGVGQKIHAAHSLSGAGAPVSAPITSSLAPSAPEFTASSSAISSSSFSSPAFRNSSRLAVSSAETSFHRSQISSGKHNSSVANSSSEPANGSVKTSIFNGASNSASSGNSPRNFPVNGTSGAAENGVPSLIVHSGAILAGVVAALI